MPDLDEGQPLFVCPPLYSGPVNAEFLAQARRTYIVVARNLNDINQSCFLLNCVSLIVFRSNRQFDDTFIR
jgi:hypothetical protein